MNTDVKIIKKFWDNVDQTSWCWNWTGFLDKRCLPIIRVNYPKFREISPRRLSIILSGQILTSKQIVYPDHLFLGTTQDNTADMMSKGRNSHGENHPGAKLIEKDILIIRKLSSEGQSRISLAKRFGVSRTTISEIALFKSWKHLK